MRAMILDWQDNTKDPTYGTRMIMDAYSPYMLAYNQCLRSDQLQFPLRHIQPMEGRGVFSVDDNVPGDNMYGAMGFLRFTALPTIRNFLDEPVLDGAYNGKANV
jgi:hypothetical protein